MILFTLLLFILSPVNKIFSDDFTDTAKHKIVFERVDNNKPKWDISNYPNPFNPSTVITFNLDADAHVTLNIFNVLGQLVQTLVNNKLPAGEHKFIFNAAGISGGIMSGVYLYRIEAWGDDGTNFSAIRKMIYTK